MMKVKPRDQNSGRGPFRRMEDNSNVLFVANMHLSLTEEQLIKLIHPYGTIVHVNYIWHMTGPKKGIPKGFAFVKMSCDSDCENVITNLNGKLICGRHLRVQRQDHPSPGVQVENFQSLDNKTVSTDDLHSEQQETGKKRSIDGEAITSTHPNDANDIPRAHPSASLHVKKKQLCDIDEKLKLLQEAIGK